MPRTQILSFHAFYRAVVSSNESAVETKFHPGNPKHLRLRHMQLNGHMCCYASEHSIATILTDPIGAFIDRLDSGRLLAMGLSDL